MKYKIFLKAKFLIRKIFIMNRREENITPNFSPSNQPLEFEFLPVKNPPVKKETIIMMIFKIDKKLPDKISK